MARITDIQNNWRRILEPASYRGVIFHVEVSGRMSGRRTVVHEYPKRNLPYAEDMGRHAVRWSFTGYIIMNDHGLQSDANQRSNRQGPFPYGSLIDQRNKLIEALERDDAGLLFHPSLSSSYQGGADGTSAGGPMMVMCERYTVTESREKGGYYEFDMQFVEAGEAPMGYVNDTKGAVLAYANAAEDAARGMLNNAVDTGIPTATPVGIGMGGV